MAPILRSQTRKLRSSTKKPKNFGIQKASKTTLKVKLSTRKADVGAWIFRENDFNFFLQKCFC